MIWHTLKRAEPATTAAFTMKMKRGREDMMEGNEEQGRGRYTFPSYLWPFKCFLGLFPGRLPAMLYRDSMVRLTCIDSAHLWKL